MHNIKLNANTVIALIDKHIETSKAHAALEVNELVKMEQEYALRPRYFGLVRGKQISREQALNSLRGAIPDLLQLVQLGACDASLDKYRELRAVAKLLVSQYGDTATVEIPDNMAVALSEALA